MNLHAAIAPLPEISRAELEDVASFLRPALDALDTVPAAHRVGHVAVLCGALLYGLDAKERAAAVAFLYSRNLN